MRNSIILVDFIQFRLREGMPLREAVVDAGAVRFRPMLLTARTLKYVRRFHDKCVKLAYPLIWPVIRPLHQWATYLCGPKMKLTRSFPV